MGFFNSNIREYRDRAIKERRFDYESKAEFYREVNETIEKNAEWRPKYMDAYKAAEEETVNTLNRCGLRTKKEKTVQFDGYDLLRMAILEEAIRDRDKVFIMSERFAEWYPDLDPEYLLRLMKERKKRKHEKLQTFKCFGN